MKKLFFCLLGLVLFSLFFVSRSTQSSYASLRVLTQPAGVTVILDQQELGVTPLQKEDLTGGVHTLTLRYPEGEKEKLAWQGKVDLTPGTLTTVQRLVPGIESFALGSSVEFRKRVNSSWAGLTVTSDPSKVEVFLDGTFLGATPLVRQNLKPGDYKIEIRGEGFVPNVLEVNFLAGFLTEIDTQLLPNFFTNLAQSDWSPGEINESIDSAPAGFNESDIGLSGSFSTREDLIYPWQKIKLYELKFNDWHNLDVNERIKLLRFYSEEVLRLNGLPFCFLVDDNGKIFEGLGVQNFNFANLEIPGSQVVFEKGECPIALLLDSNEALKLPAKKALTYISQKLLTRESYLAKNLTQLTPIELSVGEKRELSLEIQNVGRNAWLKNEIVFHPLPLEKEVEVYSGESWLNSSTVRELNQELVLPGETTQLEFDLQAPYYPSEFEQKFALVRKTNGTLVSGSEITIKMIVRGESLPVVEIQKTPTGFLNVREDPSLDAELKGVVFPGEKYLLLAEVSGWYKIRLRDESWGWIYSIYAKRI